MKFVHPILERTIEIEENKATILIIENKNVFSEIISEIKNQIEGEEGGFVFSQDIEEISISQNIELITDPFSLNFNSKKIINRLYKKLDKQAMNEEMYVKSKEIVSKINEYIADLIQDEELSISYNQELDLIKLFKAVDIHIENKDKQLVDRILEYMLIIREIFAINTFVFVNLKAFISDENLKEFYKVVFYNKMNLILFESNFNKKLDSEEVRIIDADLCEIT